MAMVSTHHARRQVVAACVKMHAYSSQCPTSSCMLAAACLQLLAHASLKMQQHASYVMPTSESASSAAERGAARFGPCVGWADLCASRVGGTVIYRGHKHGSCYETFITPKLHPTPSALHQLEGAESLPSLPGGGADSEAESLRPGGRRASGTPWWPWQIIRSHDPVGAPEAPSCIPCCHESDT